MNLGAFGPASTSTTVGASTTAATGTLTGTGSQVQIANQTTAWAYVNFGSTATSVVAATVAASLPIAPGAMAIYTVPAELAGVSVILGGGTGNVIFTRGEGM